MHKMILTLLSTALLAVAADPFVGVWKPNPAKVKISAGAPADGREKEMLKFEAKDKTTYLVHRIDPDGKEKPLWTFPLDGKERKGETNTAITNRFDRIDERHFRQQRFSQNARTVIDYAVSPDGKTLTQTRTGTGNTTGRVVDDQIVCDKVTGSH